MQYLINLAAENEDIRRISDFAAEFSAVQGIVLDVDRLWLESWAIAQLMGEEFLRRFYEWMDWRFHHHGPGMLPQPLIFGPCNQWLPRHRVYPRALNLGMLKKWRPPFWHEYAHFSGVPDTPEGLPIIVKVCVRPSMGKENIPAIEALQERTRQFRVVIEGRSQAVLSANPRRKAVPLVGGVSIGKKGFNEFGTLGVILKDSAGKRFAITCSHVVDQQNVDIIQPSQKDSKRASIFGKRIAGTSLSSCPASAACNPWSGVNTNEEDIALIEIDAKTSSALEVLDIGTLNGVVPRASISNGQSVEVMGRTTKHSFLSVGGLAVWYKMAHQKKFYCFKYLFEVGSAYGSSGTIKGGDSGAPICTANGTGNGWCGMIVGCDSLQGFAMYSESIENWWKSNKYTFSLM
jgi:hypothetical protein